MPISNFLNTWRGRLALVALIGALVIVAFAAMQSQPLLANPLIPGQLIASVSGNSQINPKMAIDCDGQVWGGWSETDQAGRTFPVIFHEGEFEPVGIEPLYQPESNVTLEGITIVKCKPMLFVMVRSTDEYAGLWASTFVSGWSNTRLASPKRFGNQTFYPEGLTAVNDHDTVIVAYEAAVDMANGWYPGKIEVRFRMKNGGWAPAFLADPTGPFGQYAPQFVMGSDGIELSYIGWEPTYPYHPAFAVHIKRFLQPPNFPNPGDGQQRDLQADITALVGGGTTALQMTDCPEGRCLLFSSTSTVYKATRGSDGTWSDFVALRFPAQALNVSACGGYVVYQNYIAPGQEVMPTLIRMGYTDSVVLDNHPVQSDAHWLNAWAVCAENGSRTEVAFMTRKLDGPWNVVFDYVGEPSTAANFPIFGAPQAGYTGLVTVPVTIVNGGVLTATFDILGPPANRVPGCGDSFFETQWVTVAPHSSSAISMTTTIIAGGPALCQNVVRFRAGSTGQDLLTGFTWFNGMIMGKSYLPVVAR